MSEDQPDQTGQQQEWRDCRPAKPEGGCDPSASIDERRCRDRGLSAQLDYTKTHADALEAARDTYAQARTDYRDKRHEAALVVQDLKHSVKHLLERIRCLVEQERVVRCLDQAFCEVEKQLDCCEGTPGCCVQAVEFDAEAPSSYRKLVRRIDRYQGLVDAAKACFDALVGEPDQLGERVAGVKADVDAIVTALADDAAKVDLKKQYAAALVAGRKLDRIWNGYADNCAYVDCLCLALTTWSSGVDAVSVLIGAKAVRDCQREAAAQWCTKLTEAPVDEILAGYDRLCGSDQNCSCGGSSGGGSGKPCGCHSDRSDDSDDSDGTGDSGGSGDGDDSGESGPGQSGRPGSGQTSGGDHPRDCGCGHSGRSSQA